MERLKKIFQKEYLKINEAALVLAFFTLLSQFLGLFRDRFLAGKIGTGTALDVYYAAFRIPDLVLVFGTSLVAVSMLLPFFHEKLIKEGKRSAKIFIDSVFSVFSLFILVSSGILFVTMPLLVRKLFPGFQEESILETVKLSRIMLLSPLFLGISNLIATITQHYKRFFIYALTPILYNLGIITGILLFYPQFGTIGLAYGVVLGALLHLSIQIPFVAKRGFLPKLRNKIVWKDILKLIQHSLPRTMTMSLTKVLFLLFTSLASLMAIGSISLFQLSYNLQSVPLAIIGVSYSVAAFPVLVSYFQEKNYGDFFAHVLGPVRQIIFWSFPIITLFIVLRAHIVRVILGSGRFSWNDTRIVAASLALFIISITAQSIALLIIRAYYAAGKTWRPFFINLFSLIFTVLFAYSSLFLYQNYTSISSFFTQILRLDGIPHTSVIMLAFSYSVGMMVNVFLFWFFFRKDFPYPIASFKIKKTFYQSILASLGIGFSSYFILQLTDKLLATKTTLGVFFHGLIAGIVGITVGIVILMLLRNEDFLSVREALSRKRGKLKNIGQENISQN